MTLEEISNKILDGSLGNGQSEIKMEDGVSENPPSEEDSLTHYGILGMKWGIRRSPKQLGRRRKKKDRRYEDETEDEYQRRMERESRERQEKIRAKSQERLQKMQLKSQRKQEQYRLKSQERREEALRDAQEKEQERRNKEAAKNTNKKTQLPGDRTKKPPTIKTMTDEELNAAINRAKREKEYQDLIRKPDGFVKKTLKTIAFTGGGVLLAVGRNIAVRQLTEVGNEKLDDFLIKKGVKKPKEDKDKKGKKGKDKRKTNDKETNSKSSRPNDDRLAYLIDNGDGTYTYDPNHQYR